MEVTEKEAVDKNIGRKFGKDGHLEIVSLCDYKTKSGGRLYFVKCNVCELDSELFGEGIFTSSLGNLTTGYLPCGCAHTVKWTKAQYIVRIKRACLVKNIELIRVYDVWEGVKTRLTLKCQIDGNIWTSSISNLLSGRGCPKCRATKISLINKGIHRNRGESDILLSENRTREIFIRTGAFHKNTVFEKVRGKDNYWKIWCPVCANDEFTKYGLCDSIFYSHESALRKGKIPCRCSRNKKYSKSQREYQIVLRIMKEGLNYKFKGWKGSYKGYSSKCLLECHVHGDFEINAKEFVDGRICQSCTGRGFDRSKLSHLYVLHIEGVAGDFIGYGITNKIKSRLQQHKRSLRRYGFYICDKVLFELNGDIALKIETEIVKNFPNSNQETPGFRRESTHLPLFSDVIKFVRQRVEDLTEIKLCWNSLE